MKTTLKKSTDRLSVKVCAIMPDGLFISVGKRDYHLPFSSAPWFKNARVPDIFNVEMLGDDAIRWDALDVDLEIECLEYPERYPLIMKLTPDEVL